MNILFILGASLLLAAMPRERLVEDKVLYVDCKTGNDDYQGVSPGMAFCTIQAAVDHIANNIDLAGHNVTIQGAPGQVHKKGVVIKGFVGTGKVIIDLAGSYIWVDEGDCISSFFTTSQGVILQNMRLRADNISTFGSGNGIIAQTPIYFGIGKGVVFDYCATTHMSSCSPGAIIQILESYTIAYSSPIHIQAACGGLITTTGRKWVVVKIQNWPSFWLAYAQAFMTGNIFLPLYHAKGSICYAPRYMCGMAGQIYTDGYAREDFFPGTHPPVIMGKGNNYQ